MGVVYACVGGGGWGLCMRVCVRVCTVVDVCSLHMPASVSTVVYGFSYAWPRYLCLFARMRMYAYLYVCN